MGKKDAGLSLLELLISLAIFSLIVIALFVVATFCYSNMINSNRRAVLQQECSFILDHVTKWFGLSAIGSMTGAADDAVRQDGANPWWKAMWDRDGNGVPDDTCGNCYRAYRFYPASNSVVYWDTTNGNFGGAGGGENLAIGRITNFNIALTPNLNFLYVTVTARNNPAAAASANNPEVTMETRISLPMVTAR